MNPRGPNRRQLLLAAIAAASAATIGGGWWLAGTRRHGPPRPAREWMAAELLRAAKELGEELLAGEFAGDEETLWRALDEKIAPWPEDGLADPAFRERVRRAVERDFADEAVVRLRGWSFDQTTAQLCVLVALSVRETNGGA